MKIIVVSHSCVVDVNQQLLVAMNDLPDTEVALLVPANWKNEYTGESMTPRFLPSVTFPVFAYPVIKPGNVSLYAYKKLPWAELRRWRPNALLAAQEPWSLSALQAQTLAKRLGIPWAFHTNQNILKNYPPPFRWIEQASYRSAKVGLAYSEEARQVLLKKGMQKPSVVVPYATDVAQFQPMPADEKKAFRVRLGLPAGAFVMGYIGRLVPEKGLDIFIEALANARKARPNANVCGLIVGVGAEEENLKALACQRGVEDALVWTGLIPHKDVAPYMAALDVFVLPSRTTPSWKEQFGRVLIEALASGVAVIGSNSGQIPHLIEDTNGGLVFDEGDANALTRQMLVMVDEPEKQRRFVEMGKRAVQERFSCDAVARKLRSLLAI